MRPPEECRTMEELRAAIDAHDRALVAMLVARARYIDRAIELKSQAGWPARIEARVDEVIENVQREAQAAGLDPALAQTLWREIVDWSIAREERVLGRDGGAE